jgi:hypothetical protein
MRQALGGVAVLLLACLAVQADDKPVDKPPSPQAQYAALVKEHREAQNAYFTAAGKAKTAQERDRARKDMEAKVEKVHARLVELAEKHPKDAVAVDALVRVAQDLSSHGKARTKALELLARDHAKSDKAGRLCQSLVSGFDSASEKLLRAILADNPSKAVRAEACLAMTQSLARRAMIARRLAGDEALSKRFEEFYGKETLAELKKADPAKLEGEGEKLTRQFVDRYLGEVTPERLVSMCQRLRFSSDRGSEVLLRALLKHDKREVQGVACLTLAQVLKQQADDTADKDEKKAAGLRNESEKLFARAAEKYADVKAGFRGTVGAEAKKELYEIRHLGVGKPAPEVEGQDQDGKKFKLADYKGKVVLLDFWSQF